MLKRGHAQTFAQDGSQASREMIERIIVSEWAKCLYEKTGICIENIRSNGAGPPDCTAEINGDVMSIEVTELVDGHVIKSIDRSRRGKSPALTGSVLFNRLQWSKDRFFNAIQNLIDDKETKYSSRIPKIEIDVLLVCSAEPWLSPHDLHTWLLSDFLKQRHSFKAAYLIKTYDPSFSKKHWPLFKLW